ncbi:MAG: outer membrane murein-binding lipoprotein Lpp [Planctomycetota bacterium]|jgi:outer membrane murein-binding lipoprotein Lpp
MWNPKTTLLPVSLAALVGLAFSTGTSQDPAGDNLAAQVQGLQDRVEQLESYNAEQAEAAKAVALALDQAVAAGYTSGINFKAREILVAAWKASAKAQIGAESGKDKGEDEKPVRGR